MPETKKKLPIGIDNFTKLRKNDFYYIDKTGLIIDLLNSWSEVTLFTRPRRFGKTLNMSMLQAFFSPEGDKSIFGGLKVSADKALCDKYMGQYPVIFITLKSINAADYDLAYRMMEDIIRDIAVQADELVGDSDKLHQADKIALKKLLVDKIEEKALFASLYTLSRILKKYYNRDVILLIDEYDVPLSIAYENGYYNQMTGMIRNLFDKSLKTNDNIKLAVLTGCMRISKESIFTGLNNLRVLGVADERADEFFGFTDSEVKELLDYYCMNGRYDEVREWYDGYLFGNEHIYCPWDVINYVDNARFSTCPFPENYWINSSGNSIIRKFIDCSGNATVKSEIESIINGGTVEKTIRQDLTYEDMYASIDNIWSVLFTTGYLTYTKRLSASRFKLKIPNREVRDIFAEQILELFKRDVKKDSGIHHSIIKALSEGDIPSLESGLRTYLRKTISIRDTAVRKTLKENFYHGILLAILSINAGWSVTSNEEVGDGYSDILVRAEDMSLAMVIEIKYADDGGLEEACKKALSQIKERDYASGLYEDGYSSVLKYGIAFHIKKCRVMLEK